MPAWCARQGLRPAEGYLERYPGSEYSLAFLPKVEITVWVRDERAEEVAERLVKVARTGRIGDGKVFVVDCPFPEAMEF